MSLRRRRRKLTLPIFWIVSKTQTQKFLEFYEEDELKPSALRLDQDFIAKMEERARKLENEEKFKDEGDFTEDSQDPELMKDEF